MARIDILAVASFGGHLEQLLELRPAWQRKTCHYVTTRPDPIEALGQERISVVQDCHQGQVFRGALCLAQLTAIVSQSRPRTIVTTGALPGLLACMVGRASGARTIWIDSLANAAELSASGKLARRFAHHHFTQWPDVAHKTGSEYAGSLL